jgi:toxin ParE1/3/4
MSKISSVAGASAFRRPSPTNAVAKIELAQRARADLDEIWRYIAQDNLTAADGVLDRIKDRIQTLAEFPQLGPRWPIIAPDVRVLTAGDYLILYRYRGARVQVARIVHGARHLEALWQMDDSDPN